MNDKEKLLLNGLVFGRTYLIPVEKRDERFQEVLKGYSFYERKRQQMQVNKGEKIQPVVR